MIYLGEIMEQSCLRFVKYVGDSRREDDFLRINGVGIHEPMTGAVDRPGGTNDRLLMFFYDPVELRRGGGLQLPMTLYLWPDKAPHFYGNPVPGARWMHSWIHFHGTYAESLLEECNWQSGQPYLLADVTVLERDLHDLYREILDSAADPAVVRAMFEILIRSLARQLPDNLKAHVPEKLAQVKAAMTAQAGNGRDLAEYALRAGMSPSHFSAQFKHCFGISPVAFARHAALEKAAYLLQNRQLRIGEVALMTGFPDIYSFSRAFKKHFGAAPGELRGQK